MSSIERLFDLVNADEELEGVHINSQGFHIRCKANKLKTLVPADALDHADWDTIKGVLVGEREPTVLRHMTRVVGYYSNVSNWNPSKIGELHDRQAGNYALTGSEIEAPQADPVQEATNANFMAATARVGA